MPTLDWVQPADGGAFRGNIVVLVDGVVVWRAPEEFYRVAPATLEIAANKIGGSSCGESFTGGIIGIDRPNSDSASERR
jgi:hypothetical protein